MLKILHSQLHLTASYLPLKVADIEKSWMDHSLDFRTDMMSHLMRKRNAELLQIRQAPRINL